MFPFELFLKENFSFWIKLISTVELINNLADINRNFDLSQISSLNAVDEIFKFVFLNLIIGINFHCFLLKNIKVSN